MVTVNVLVQKKVKEIKLVGHSGFDVYGKDIVCSAISSIVITTVNAIIMFDKNYINCEQNDDEFTITYSADTCESFLFRNSSTNRELFQLSLKPKYIEYNTLSSILGRGNSQVEYI